MVKTSEIKPQDSKTILGKAKNILDKITDKIAADKTPDPDNLKPKKNYETAEYWEQRDKEEKLNSKFAPTKDRGIDY